MKKETNTDWKTPLIVIVGIIIIAIILFGLPIKNKDTKIQEEPIKILELSKSNFVYVNNYNMNSGVANNYCNEYKAHDCKAIADAFNIPYNEIKTECWKHFWNFEYKLINMPEEVMPYYSDVKCKAYQDGELLKTEINQLSGNPYYEDFQDFGSPEGSEIQSITFDVDVTKESKIMLCCQINKTSVQPPASVDSKGNPIEVTYGDSEGNTFIRKAGKVYGTLSNEVCLDPVPIKGCQSR